jgi:hypothetical protein
MASPTQLIGGSFQDPQGNLLADGYLKFQLSQDCSAPGNISIGAGVVITVDLGATGSVSTSPAQYIWGNDDLTPVNNFYKVTGYTADGQIAWGPNNQQVVSGSTFDVGTWVPNQIVSWFPMVGPPGATGPAGSNGVTGPTGAQGPAGSPASTDAGWHRFVFGPYTTDSSDLMVGEGISVFAESSNQNTGFFDFAFRTPVPGVMPMAMQIGGSQNQGNLVAEWVGVTDNSMITGEANGFGYAPIDVSELNLWEVGLCPNFARLTAWAASTYVPDGAYLGPTGPTGPGSFWYQNILAHNSYPSVTGTSIPTFPTTADSSVSDNTAVWYCIGQTGPADICPFLAGICDYNGVINTEQSGSALQFMNPTNTRFGGPYNFIGFRYQPAFQASSSDVPSNGNPARYGGDQTIKIWVVGPALGNTLVDTGVTPSTPNAYYKLTIEQPTVGTFTFYINGSLVGTVTGVIPPNPMWSQIFADSYDAVYQQSEHSIGGSTEWWPIQAYGLGAIINGFNGDYYECIQAGTSGSSLPSGFTSQYPNPSAGSTVTDGTVIWMAITPGANSSYYYGGCVALTHLYWLSNIF